MANAGAVVAEFDSTEAALAGATEMRILGYDRVEAYAPFPIPELAALLGIRRTRVPRFVLAAGLAGAALSFLVVWWTNAVDYALNVGGRPVSSLPADVPIVFESTVLFAGITAFALALFASGLPRLHVPIMDAEGFERTSLDRIWLVVLDSRSATDAELALRLTRAGAIALRPLRATR